MAIEMMAAPYGGEACAVVLGRSGGPAFRRSELLRLVHLTGIAVDGRRAAAGLSRPAAGVRAGGGLVAARRLLVDGQLSTRPRAARRCCSSRAE